MSYEIDCRIREGADFDKLLASYDKLVKTAEFTPKNVKNINDFDSVGELIKWLEKKGWRNKFYDNVTRDVVDETIKNI
jgi:molybdopterin converting factor small subunit